MTDNVTDLSEYRESKNFKVEGAGWVVTVGLNNWVSVTGTCRTPEALTELVSALTSVRDHPSRA